jgi:6,7-dimethyl-8-ribityllumazine synthase
MSGVGAPSLQIDASGMRVAVVAALWHDTVMQGLIDGALRASAAAGAEAEILRVPGAFELPLGCQAAAHTGNFDAVIALGVVIRGGTPHFEYVCQAATTGLEAVARVSNVPVGFGLLTCDDEQQALDRAGLAGSREDKGAEATQAALALALTLRSLSASS